MAVIACLTLVSCRIAISTDDASEPSSFLNPQSVSLTILAVRPNNPSLAVIDLMSSTTTLYPPGENGLRGDAIDTVVISASGDTIISADRFARVFKTGFETFSSELSMPPRHPGSGVSDGFWVVPTVNGNRVWLMRSGYRGDAVQIDGMAQLVEVATGKIVDHKDDLVHTAYPVGAVDEGLLIGTSNFELQGPEAGWTVVVGSERTLILGEDGRLTDLGPGQPLIAEGSILVRQLCDAEDGDCKLVIEDLKDGPVALPRPPKDMHWVTTNAQLAPTASQPLRAVSPDGLWLLLAATTGFDEGLVARWELHAIALFGADQSRFLTSWEGPARTATWARDSRWVALITNSEVTLIDSTGGDPDIMLEALWPDDHFPMAAG